MGPGTARALKEHGIEADIVPKRSVAEPLEVGGIAAISRADYVTVTSASTVRHLLEAAGAKALDGPRLASIGPATSAELRAHDLEPDVEADPHTPDGLVDAVLADARR
jgi:uroporphyrinogen III methyltransferase/synthase